MKKEEIKPQYFWNISLVAALEHPEDVPHTVSMLLLLHNGYIGFTYVFFQSRGYILYVSQFQYMYVCVYW